VVLIGIDHRGTVFQEQRHEDIQDRRGRKDLSGTGDESPHGILHNDSLFIVHNRERKGVAAECGSIAGNTSTWGCTGVRTRRDRGLLHEHSGNEAGDRIWNSARISRSKARSSRSRSLTRNSW